MGVRGLERPGVQQPGHLDAQVVGVQRRPGDVQRGALVRDIVNTIAITAIQAQASGPA